MENSRELELGFTPEHVSAFLAFSRDRNPLHIDPEYSRRTQFGRPVIYGVAGLLALLGRWAEGRSFALLSIQAKFHRPLFVGEHYNMRISETGESVKGEILKGGHAHARVKFSWKPFNAKASPANSGKFQPLAEAQGWDGQLPIARLAGGSFDYEPDWTAAPPLAKQFGLNPGQLPPAQLSALVGASYFIGMEVPGRQALFSELNFVFEDEASPLADLQLKDLDLTFTQRANLLAVSGKGAGIRSFQLSAFRRPEPVNHSLESVRQAVGQSKNLDAKTVFISGASRGFGAVLAKGFALQGAGVGLNYRSGHNEAAEVEQELRSVGTPTLLLKGDTIKEKDCQRMAEEFLAKFGKVDFLVCNASPPIHAALFLAQTPEEFMEFVQNSILVTSNLLRAFLPRLQPGAVVIDVSSIFTVEPKEQFTHYVAAKSAVEGLMRALASEHKNIRFLIVRPPRMLTDQTNLPYNPEPPVSAMEVAARLIEYLKKSDLTGNLHETNLL